VKKTCGGGLLSRRSIGSRTYEGAHAFLGRTEARPKDVGSDVQTLRASKTHRVVDGAGDSRGADRAPLSASAGAIVVDEAKQVRGGPRGKGGRKMMNETANTEPTAVETAPTEAPPAPKRRGFAAMTLEARTEIARRGGRAAAATGNSYKFNKETAARAAEKSGHVRRARARKAAAS
jgi:general stress protein YciG